jgi:hypothetical protein
VDPPPSGGGKIASLDGRPLLLLAMVAALVAGATTVLAVELNRNFLVSASDTSVFHNTLANLVRGHGFRVTAYSGPNLLGQHGMFVLVLVAPLYRLASSVEMLFALQVWVVFSAVIPLYLIAREILEERWTAFVVGLLGLSSPLLFQMALAPFHPESGILAGVFWSFYFYRRNDALGFWISFALAVSCAEQAALIYLAMGLALLVADDGLAWRRRYAKFALIGGAAWLIFTMGLLIPAMYRPGQLNVMRYHYWQWGAGSSRELAVAVARDPMRALDCLLSPLRWLYVLELIGLPLVLAFVSPRALLLLAPFPFYFLLSDHEFFLNFHAYYFQFAFFAGYVGLCHFLARRDVPARRRTVILGAMLVANLLALYPVARDFAGLTRDRDEALNRDLRAAFEAIPADAGVYTATRFSAYLSNRPDIVMGDLAEPHFDLKARLDEEFAFTDVRPEQVDYIVCDILNDQCGPRMSGFHSGEAKIRAANIVRYIRSGQWQVFLNESYVVILRRAGR